MEFDLGSNTDSSESVFQINEPQECSRAKRFQWRILSYLAHNYLRIIASLLLLIIILLASLSIIVYYYMHLDLSSNLEYVENTDSTTAITTEPVLNPVETSTISDCLNKEIGRKYPVRK